MARYESKSEEFGQGILQDQRKRADKVAKEQESFAKKITAASFASKGINTYLNDRMDTFNQSLADEKAYLKTQQDKAKALLTTQATLDSGGISTSEYIREKLLENRQSALERRVKDATTQVPNSSGDIVERVAINIPKATLATRDDWTRIVDGKSVATTFDELVADGVKNWDEAITQARNVPTDAKDIQNYLDTYAKQELPSNLFSFVTRGLGGFFKGETRESLQDKISKTTQETLNNPLFDAFNNFAVKAAGMNNIFPDITQDGLDSFQKSLEYKNGVLVDSDNANKIVKDITAKFDVSSQIIDNPETNEKTTATVLTPTFTTTYVDGTMTARVDKENAKTVTEGSQLITVYDEAFLNIVNDDMNQLGQEDWAKYSKDRFKEVSANPMIEWGKFIQTGVVAGGSDVNKYLKTDIDAGSLIEKVLQAGGVDVSKITAFRMKEKNETEEEYRKKQEDWAKRTGQLMEDSLMPVMGTLTTLADMLNQGTRL